MLKKKNKEGKTMREVGETSEKMMQQELMAIEELFAATKVDTNEAEDDWYAEWPQLEKPLISHLSFPSQKQPDSAGSPVKEAADVSILVPACGKSKLSENLYDAGFKNITNVDISKDVISDMFKRNLRVRPEMKWRVMDITKLQFENETFDAIVDKGGLDSLMKPMLDASLGCRYLSEVKRVLRAGGKFVCLTLAESRVLDLLFPMFRFGWKMCLYAIGQEASSRDPKLQIFMVVAEKDTSPEVHLISSIMEQNLFDSNSNQARDLAEALERDKMTRLEYGDGNGFIYSLKDLLLGAIGDHSKLVPGRRVNISLGRPEGFINKGVLLDAKEDSGPFIYPYAVFIVPHHRAHEWMFTSEKGQWLIVESSRASRLLMIYLDSSNSNLSMDDIQMDLCPFVMQLEPEDCGEGFQTPYLSEPEEIKQREIVYEGWSALTGPIVVEDVIYNDNDIIKAGVDDDYKGCTFRRLIFKNTDSVVQSEALLSIKESNRISTDVGKDKEQQASEREKKGEQKISDSQSSISPVSSREVKVVHDYLVSPYHNRIVFGIRLISSYWNVSTSARGLVKTVVIGLGGGLLPMFLKNHLPFLKIEVVELDREVLHVAREYFGFSDDENLKVHIADGTMFVKEKADEKSSCKYDIIVIDVDSSDPSSPLASPAASFLHMFFLLDVKKLLSEQGLFIVNLVAASSDLKKRVYSNLKKVFSCVSFLPIEKGVDEVLFALKTTSTTINKNQLSEAREEYIKTLEFERKWIDTEEKVLKSFKLVK